MYQGREACLTVDKLNVDVSEFMLIGTQQH